MITARGEASCAIIRSRLRLVRHHPPHRRGLYTLVGNHHHGLAFQLKALRLELRKGKPSSCLTDLPRRLFVGGELAIIRPILNR
jgi:hypothetical protein